LVPVVLYLVIGIGLYLFQDKLLFHPEPVPLSYHYNFDQPYEEFNLPFRDGNLNILRFRPGSAVKGCVLYFHGNMSNVERYRQDPEKFLRNGYEVWMMDYPGFGKSTGARSEEAIYEQALALYQLVIKSGGADHPVIYGKSIGTGVAAFLATRINAKALILETPYYSIPSLAGYYAPLYPVSLLNKYSFPVNRYLSNLNMPVTIFHGTDDGTVPYAQSLKLKKENTGINLITIPGGGHNNLGSFPFYQEKMDSLLVGLK